jgi:hypothetical protein
MEYLASDSEMEIALRKMFEEMFPNVSISRFGVAMLAAEIEALEKKCAVMRSHIVMDHPRKKLKSLSS